MNEEQYINKFLTKQEMVSKEILEEVDTQIL